MVALKLVKSLWGVDDALRRDRWPTLLARIKADGYSAVECNSSVWRIDPEAFKALLSQHSLLLIAQIHTTGSAAGEQPPYAYMSSRSVEQHVRSLRELVAEAKSIGAFLVNSHSGFLRAALEVEAAAGLPLLHETHRRRIFWNPFIFRDVLLGCGDLSGVKVNADLSHWVVVCERVFDCPAHQRINGSDDEWWPQVLSLVQLCLRASFTHTPPLSPLTGAQVAQHAHLLHARVAYREGPQVPDPSDAAWANEVAAHERWWSQIFAAQVQRGADAVYAEPEFGPAPYMHTLPHTDTPVADLWTVNEFMAERLRTLFASSCGGSGSS